MTRPEQHRTSGALRTPTPRGHRSGLIAAGRDVLALVVTLTLIVGCARAPFAFPLRAPLDVDPDRRPFAEPPAENYSSLYWDGADQMFFRPLARLWTLEAAAEAVNVNALDEVPDSSWWTNRIGAFEISPEAAQEGPCAGVPPLDEASGPWEVFKAKPNGATPGFFMSAPDGRKYLFKTDGLLQAPRPTAADAIGSRLYWLAGYNAPCNRVVFVDRSIFTMKKGAKSEDDWGAKVPMTLRDIDDVLAKGARTSDGRYRGSVSLLLDGKILGPFRYEGTRDDDPNDVVPHQERRELRASQVIGGWLNHTDAREQNTLDTWVSAGKSGGYVKHYFLDFSDCLGTVWDPPALGRRLGHSSYFDVDDVALDLTTLGLLQRPWEEKRFGPSGPVFGYFDIEHYDPEGWQPGYDNPAMLRQTEHDAAWMARIVARIGDGHLRAILREARFEDRRLENEALRLLQGRQRKLLTRYLSRLSPLSHPELGRTEHGARICLEDAAVVAGIADQRARGYVAQARVGGGDGVLALRVEKTARGACVTLPRLAGVSQKHPTYVRVDVGIGAESQTLPPVRVHLYALGAFDYRVVGLERLDDDDSS